MIFVWFFSLKKLNLFIKLSFEEKFESIIDFISGRKILIPNISNTVEIKNRKIKK